KMKPLTLNFYVTAMTIKIDKPSLHQEGHRPSDGRRVLFERSRHIVCIEFGRAYFAGISHSHEQGIEVIKTYQLVKGLFLKVLLRSKYSRDLGFGIQDSNIQTIGV